MDIQIHNPDEEIRLYITVSRRHKALLKIMASADDTTMEQTFGRLIEEAAEQRGLRTRSAPARVASSYKGNTTNATNFSQEPRS